VQHIPAVVLNFKISNLLMLLLRHKERTWTHACCLMYHGFCMLLCWGICVLQVVALQGVMGLPEEQASAQLIIERCVRQQLGTGSSTAAQHKAMAGTPCQPSINIPVQQLYRAFLQGAV
jgi:hypothetical protein